MSHFLRKLCKLNLNHIIQRNIYKTACLQYQGATKDKKIAKTQESLIGFDKVFHDKNVVKIAIFQKLKIVTTGLCVALFPITVAYPEAELFASVFGLATFSTVSLLFIGQFLSRFVGIIYLDKSQKKVKFQLL